MADAMVLLPNINALHLPSSAAPNAAGSFVDFVLPVPAIAPASPSSPSQATSRTSLRGSTQQLANSNFRTWQHVREPLFGKNLSVVIIEERKYLIGVQIAKLLKRETFNLYRSMKVKGIEIVRAVSEQVEFLMRVNAVKRGTRSVTLISYEPTVEFVEHEFQRIQKSDAPRRGERFDNEDSDSDSAPPAGSVSRKRANVGNTGSEGNRSDIKRSRSSSGSDPEEYTGDLPEPWEILLSLAHGRFFKQ